jgi:hypothetical protein
MQTSLKKTLFARETEDRVQRRGQKAEQEKHPQAKQ